MSSSEIRASEADETQSLDADRERGFLLIADMEGSTGSKFTLGETGAFAALREHNRIVMEHCAKAAPVAGVLLNALGDAVVAKFPISSDPRAGLVSCLRAARDIVHAFEALEPIPTLSGGEFRLRTKLTLQIYDAYCYGRRGGSDLLAEELVGPDIDLAFRLSAVAWRLQVLVTERFVSELLARSTPQGGRGAAADSHDLDSRRLLERAHLVRHFGAQSPGPLQGTSEALEIADGDSPIEFWLTDAREIARMKGIPDAQSAFLVSFESPESLIERGSPQRLTIKVRQDHHAVILVNVALGSHMNDDYIDHVVHMLREASDGSRLDSEVTLCLAAKIYGEFDFVFRVSCIDDISLRRFFEAIHDESFGVNHVEVRSALTDRFAVTQQYDRILERFDGKPYEIALTWFQRDPDSDLFEQFLAYMDREDPELHPVEILEVGEVIHHMPIYALFICDSLRDYATFFRDNGLRPTACRSHIGHIDRPGDAQLRYSLMSGVYNPRRRPTPGG
ncbi:MAG: hypothetical protein JRG76_07775 [Deltaproteobacteria bacterium]|nr:hypothetical protein [Deltaproteobacteria bacterium]MBW2414395.1 hypothetical protein [Deltaproteobacteria bacterium]